MFTSSPRGTTSPHQRALLLAAKNDHRDAQDELLRRYEPMIGAIVARLRLPGGCEPADIAQEARLGLLRAIRAWQPERGPFPAFAALCARNQALTALDAAGARKHQFLNRARSLDDDQPSPNAPLKMLETTEHSNDAEKPSEGEFCLPLGEPVLSTGTDADPLRIVIAREQIDAMIAARRAMTVGQRQVFAGMLNDKSQRQLAAELGWPRKTVMLAQRSAREKLAAHQALAA